MLENGNKLRNLDYGGEEWNFRGEVLFFDSSRKKTIYENAVYVLVRSVQGVIALKDFCCNYDMPTIWQDDCGNVIIPEEPGFYVWDDDNDEWKKKYITI